MSHTIGNTKEENIMEPLFSYLDKGIDNMEAGKCTRLMIRSILSMTD